LKQVAYNGQGLALWRYSVIVQPEPKLSKVIKLMLYSITGVIHQPEPQLSSGLDDEFMFVQPP
jgi:hypothetical protein